MPDVVHACRFRFVITSLDPARTFTGKYETLVVNAHGCGVIVREQLQKALPDMKL